MEEEKELRKRSWERYGDLLQKTYPFASERPRMSNLERAAQFSPFSALTGYEDAVEETARLTEDEKELDENRKAMLDEKLQILSQNLLSEPLVSVIYFVPDCQKSGGEYVNRTGRIKKIDHYQKRIILDDETKIPIKQIYEINSDLFRNLSEIC